jgi:predicted RNA-binding protein
MCEAHAYLMADKGEERIMENVVRIRPEAEEVVLTDLFGDELRVPGHIQEIALAERRIIIAKG